MMRRIVQTAATITLAITLFTAGFMACAATPVATFVLSSVASNAEGSPYSQEELTQLALKTYEFTIFGTGKITDIPLEPDAISHLVDVNKVIQPLLLPLLCCYALTAACFFVLVRYYGRKVTAAPLCIGGGITLAIFVLLSLWATINFNSLFAWMHSLFFAAGTWQFSADSLLIRMYPINFWVGMAIIWFATSCLLSAASMLLGKHSRKRSVNTR